MDTNDGAGVTNTEDSERKRVVWIANYAGHDYEPAKKYGEVKPITRGFVSFQSLDRLRYQLAMGIIDVKPDDYILLSGSAIVCVNIVLLIYVRYGVVNIMNYDRRTNDYRVVTITEDNSKMLLQALGVGQEYANNS